LHKEQPSYRILFVCLGNICRSPAAEAVLQKQVAEASLNAEIFVDSAGTGGWHVGERADPRMREHGQCRGYDLKSRARQFVADDFAKFDLIVTMDPSNFENVMALAEKGGSPNNVRPFVEFCEGKYAEVPDPYYGGPKGFDLVIDILEDGCRGIMQAALKALGKEQGSGLQEDSKS
jgi:protein-tyrosine phosphatase